MTKRIGLYLGHPPGGGGTFQYSLTILDALAALPAERYTKVVAYSDPDWQRCLRHYDIKAIAVPPDRLNRALVQGWALLGLPLAPWRALARFFNPMARTLLRERCDLWIFPSQDARSAQVPVPALVSIHDLMHRYERFPESGSRWQHLNRERNYGGICRWARGVLVDSATGGRHVQESYHMAPERIHVLPFIAPSYIHAPEVPAGFDERYPLPAKFIFYPAQFWEHKNHRRLIEALALLKGELPDLKLVLVGSRKNAYDAVADLVRRHGLQEEVIFLGYVPDQDMPELYRRARALVMPTFYGPTNIPPLEAFAAGCPAAVSRIYAMPEQVGDAALLFDPNSAAEIADCIRRLWLDDDLCARLIERGRKRSERWGQKQFNERVRAIIDAVAGAPGR